VFTQRSVTAVTPAKVGCSTLQLQYSCYLISCYRAQNVLGVVRRREYKSFSTYTAAAWAETKTQCFLHVKLPGSLFAVKIFSWNCTSCQIEFSKFSVEIVPLVKFNFKLKFFRDTSFSQRGWLWWDFCSSFTRFLLKPRCKESCSSLHSRFNKVSIAKKLKLFIQNSFFTLSTCTQYRIHCWRGFED